MIKGIASTKFIKVDVPKYSAPSNDTFRMKTAHRISMMFELIIMTHRNRMSICTNEKRIRHCPI